MKQIPKIRITFSVALVIISSCTNNSQIPGDIKTARNTTFATKGEGDQIKKDTIETDYAIGRDKDGNQTYFIGLKGYPGVDTTWTQSNTTRKVDGNKTFIYDESNEVQMIFIEKGDTSFTYSADDLDEPTGYIITDDIGLVERYDEFWNKREVFLDRKVDEVGNLIYYVLNERYVPSESHKRIYSEGELLKKEAEGLKSKIVEIEYEYY